MKGNADPGREKDDPIVENTPFRYQPHPRDLQRLVKEYSAYFIPTKAFNDVSQTALIVYRYMDPDTLGWLRFSGVDHRPFRQLSLGGKAGYAV